MFETAGSGITIAKDRIDHFPTVCLGIFAQCAEGYGNLIRSFGAAVIAVAIGFGFQAGQCIIHHLLQFCIGGFCAQSVELGFTIVVRGQPLKYHCGGVNVRSRAVDRPETAFQLIGF